MKLPKIFIPEKNLEKNVKELLKEKVIKYREIEDTFSLLELPEDIGDYKTHYEKIEDKKIPAYTWCKHFENLYPQYPIEAAKIQYFKKSDLAERIFIYSLNFSSDSELNSVIRRTKVTKKFIDPNIVEGFIDPKYKDWTIKCLKKNNYMIAILINKEGTNGLKFFKDWYINNFGMIEI